MSADINRHGTFSSSNAWKLMTNGKRDMTEDEIEQHKKDFPKSRARTITTEFGAPALKYIKQVGYELLLGRPVGSEAEFKQTSWGKLCEEWIHSEDELMSIAYKQLTNTRFFHKKIPFWSGAPDWVIGTTVCDGKSPFSLEMFCDKIDILSKGVESYKEEFPNDYWQHISNAILLESNGIEITHFEAIIYVPFKSELEGIRQFARDENDIDLQRMYSFVNFKEDEELPYLVEGRHYTNINKFRFEISDLDKKELTERIIKAGKMLNKLWV